MPYFLLLLVLFLLDMLGMGWQGLLPLMLSQLHSRRSRHAWCYPTDHACPVEKLWKRRRRVGEVSKRIKKKNSDFDPVLKKISKKKKITHRNAWETKWFGLLTLVPSSRAVLASLLPTKILILCFGAYLAR